MKREHLLTALFVLIAAVFFYLFYKILIPFFAPITWAAVFVITFFPIFQRLKTKVKSGGLAAVLMCLAILVLILGPVGYLFVALVNEAADAVTRVNALYESGRLKELLAVNLPWVDAAKARLSQYYDLSKINIDQLFSDGIGRVSSLVFSQTSSLIANAAKAVFYFILMLFTMFYFFKDGQGIVDRLKRLMPLPPEQVHLIFGQLRDLVQATMYGGVVVALIQGILGGTLFAIVGIPSAVFWGAIMAFLSIIPVLGAFIIYIPAGIVLAAGGAYIKGIIVVVIGTVLISQVDNILRPVLVSGKTTMHPLMLFFSMLGGVAFFGLLGMVVGPLVAAVFMTLLRIFELRLQTQTEAPNALEAK
ncbi:MAG TPA: AI-2E family transporter [Candidatus Deferrimicrobium sp.]|nr:AI-2E family transporter [Candidatus Deferrimicrobium sp.]